MDIKLHDCDNHWCHAPHGACELKCIITIVAIVNAGHAPHGACELKLIIYDNPPTFVGVTLPTERVS